MTWRLGLVVPSDPAAELRVGNVTRGWEEGKVLAFDDSFEHEVWYRADPTVRRAVLIVDVFHPDITPANRAKAPRFG
jgi:aspartyl/asparaginyl beta-hydroxylase (cupin superfamily)